MDETARDLLRAKAEKERAEAAKHQADVIVANLQADLYRQSLEGGRITLDKALRTEKDELAANKYHHVYIFDSSVTSGSVSACIQQLTLWTRSTPNCDIEIVFNSPGGSVIDGLALFDFIQSIRKRGHKVTTSTIGYAASMAGILLQAGDVRVMGKQSWLLIHEASFGAGGKIGEVEDTVEWVKRVMKRVINIFAERCQATNAPKKLTKRQIAANWKRKDWWISSDEALDFGLIDAIGPGHSEEI